MTLQVKKLAGIPIAVVHRATHSVWELRNNPNRLPKFGEPASHSPCFVAQKINVPFVKWKKGIELPAPPPTPAYHDALALRNSFMELKTDQEFLTFLNQVGSFTFLAEVEHKYGWTLNELIGCQEMFTELARRSPNTWNEYAQGLISSMSRVPGGIVRALELRSCHKIEFRWKGAPHGAWHGGKSLALIEATDAVSAILTTIEVDHLRGAKFGACARPDCPKFFEITSHHKRKYCSQYCAHLESLRRMRKRQKRESLKGRAKVSLE